MTEIRDRIVGSEMEYSITALDHDDREIPYSLKITPEFVENYLPEGVSQTSNMLSNGGRYYDDLHFAEYATPEELDFEDMVIREFAGERIVIQSLIRYFADNPEMRFAYIRKRVLDDHRKTWGYHLNLSSDTTSIPVFNDYTMHMLGLHLATSQPLIGSGTTYYNRTTKQREYSYGQKVLDPNLVDCDIDTQDKTALINTRHEPLAGRGHRRVHVTCLDPHISPWAAKMTVGTLSLVLRIIEQGHGHKIRAGIYSSHSMSAIAVTNATDLTHKQVVRMDEGPAITPTEIQQTIIELAERTEHTDQEAKILKEWRKAIEDLRSNPMSLANRSDAIGRLHTIQQSNIRRKIDPGDMTTDAAKIADAYYDRIFEVGTQRFPRDNADPLEAYRKSGAHIIRRRQKTSERSIEQAILHPPKTTRAYARAALIASGKVEKVSWEGYTKWGTPCSLPDPYQSTLEP